jgi:recombination protein RecT
MTNNLSTVSGFSNVLKNYEKSIASLLQNKYGISVEQFYITCVNAVKKNPKLLNCDPKSLFGAILLSAECGLRPNTEEQHAFIIPYKGEAKFQVGYKGLIEMMYRNPRVKKIYAEAVFEKDEFDYWYGLNPDLKHKPYRGLDKGHLVCVYAICKLDDGETIFTVVEKNELDKIKSFSQSVSSENSSKYSPYNNGTDVHHFMEIKSAIKKLSKMIPKAGVVEISKAVDYDSRFEGGATVTVEIPTDSEQIVQPEIVSKSLVNSFETAFDDVVLPENTHKVVSEDVFTDSEISDDSNISFDLSDDTEDTSLF